MSETELSDKLHTELLRLRDEFELTDSMWARAANVRQQDVSRYTRRTVLFPSIEFLNSLCIPFAKSLWMVLAEIHGDTQVRSQNFTKREVRVITQLRAMPPLARVAQEVLCGLPQPDSDEFKQAPALLRRAYETCYESVAVAARSTNGVARPEPVRSHRPKTAVVGRR